MKFVDIERINYLFDHRLRNINDELWFSNTVKELCNEQHISLVFRIFERPMVMDSLNLNLSQISCQIVGFNGFVDLQISADFWI